jgi:hypothetical protein
VGRYVAATVSRSNGRTQATSPVIDLLVQVRQCGRATSPVPLGLEVLVGEAEVRVQLLVVGAVRVIGDREVPSVLRSMSGRRPVTTQKVDQRTKR